MKKFNLIIIAVLLIASMSCEKEGPMGPEGPQGEQGPPGEQGDPGTANVIFSDWITIEPDDWNILNNIAGYSIVAPKLTAAIMNSGLITVYMTNTGGEAFAIYQLPFITNVPSNYYEYRPFEGSIRIVVGKPDGTAPFLPTALDFRYVLIPGSVNANAVLKDIDLNDYGAVAHALGMEP